MEWQYKLMENNRAYENNKITSDEITKIRAGLTKDRFLILKAIYETPNIQHKTLSEKLNKTPNNLSNMIEKINKMDFKLIRTEQSGTKKRYSLTAIATQYVEHELLSETQFSKTSEPIHSKFTETLITKGKKTAILLKEKCDTELYSILTSLLYEGKNVTVNIEIQKLYNDLINILCDCRKQDIDINQILDALEDESSVDQITKYLDEKFIYFDFFKPLLSPGKLNIATQFQIIDIVFSELHPSIFSPYQDAELQTAALTPMEWNNLLLGVVKLSTEFINRQYSKSNAVTNWEKYYLTKELAFYIAEKCSLLVFLHRLIPNP